MNVDELVGKQRLVAIVVAGLELEGAGSDVDLVVEALQHASGLQLGVAAIPRFGRQFGAAAVTGQHGVEAVLRQGEGHADRLRLGDHREERGVIGGDEVADVDLTQTDAAGNRRADLGEFEIELGVVDRCLIGLDRAQILPHQRFGGVEGLFGDAVFFIQPTITLDVDLGVFQLRLILQQRAFGLEQSILVRTRIDLGQQVARLDHLPFFEMNLHQFAAHPAAHVDGIERGDRAQCLVIQREVALHRRRHTHRNRPGTAAEARPHHSRAPGMAGGRFVAARLVSRAGGPEFPAQDSDDQQDQQADQPATGFAGERLHGVIDHWARGLLLREAER